MSATLNPWVKPTRSPEGRERELSVSGVQVVPPISLYEVMAWEPRWRRLLFRVLLPVDILVDYRIDPVTLLDLNGKPTFRIHPGQADRSVRLELYHRADAEDPMMELELADTSFNQIEVLWLAIQDPLGPRFDIDRLPGGQDTMRGVLRRNIDAEEAALAAGLAPGQIRRGMGVFSEQVGRLETFMSCLNQREYIAQPLFYHTAVLFERVGCAYIQGHARMVQIDRGFAPGGDLRARLDGSSPFRDPRLADSVRGRAWAVHTGILDEPWDRVRMVRRLGVDAGIDTCPGLPW